MVKTPRHKARAPRQTGALLPHMCDALCAPSAVPPERIAGIDEAGRGCLAGPVVAAAVILPENYDLPLLTDSKALRPDQRETLAQAIRAQAVAWGLGIVWQKDIDRLNILQATFHAMSRAVQNLRARPVTGSGQCNAHRSDSRNDQHNAQRSGQCNDHNQLRSRPIIPALLRVDGNKCIPLAVYDSYVPARIPQEAIIGGDACIPCISAASILAKTYRDLVLDHLHRRWPVYDFAKHKGYGTAEHRAALADHGPCPLHRLTFGGVRPPHLSAEDVRRQLGLIPEMPTANAHSVATTEATPASAVDSASAAARTKRGRSTAAKKSGQGEQYSLLTHSAPQEAQ